MSRKTYQVFNKTKNFLYKSKEVFMMKQFEVILSSIEGGLSCFEKVLLL